MLSTCGSPAANVESSSLSAPPLQELDMAQRLAGKRVAILATHGFEQSELVDPKKQLEGWGAHVTVVSPAAEKRIKGWKEKNWDDEVAVDQPLSEASADAF